MRKFIERVTITGADDAVFHDNLLRITTEFPFVEWALLVNGKPKAPRYPSLDWLMQLDLRWSDLLMSDDVLPRFSMHVSGRLARRVVAGGSPESFSGIDLFERVQFNLKSCEYTNDNFLQELTIPDKKFIFQVESFDNDFFRRAKQYVPTLQPLYDKSGGEGVLPQTWEPAREYCGYAGGLNPENLAEELSKIADAAGEFPVWIDVESGVRTNNQFDLNKVRKFLEISAPYVL